MTLLGWDASDYDWMRQPLDLAAARADGVEFFTHKATEGSSIVHDHYGEAMRRARTAGVPILGPYAVPRTPGNGGHGSVGAQVSYFLNYVDSQSPWWRAATNTFIQIDLEKWPYDNVSPAVGKAFADLVAQRTGKRVIMYGSRGQYGDTLAGLGYPLWTANYGNNPATDAHSGYPGDDSSRWQAYSGQVPAILQYGSRLRIGNQPGCDANAFRGTLDDLRRLLTPEDTMSLSSEYIDVINPDGTTQPDKLTAGYILSQTNRAAWLAYAATQALADTLRETNKILEREFAKLGELLSAVQRPPAIDAATLKSALRDVLGSLDGAIPPAGD